MKRMDGMNALAPLLSCLFAPAAGREADREARARQAETSVTGRPNWWEIENIDGRNEEHPTCMLPLILPDWDGR